MPEDKKLIELSCGRAAHKVLNGYEFFGSADGKPHKGWGVSYAYVTPETLEQIKRDRPQDFLPHNGWDAMIQVIG